MQNTREREFIIKMIIEMKKKKISMTRLAKETDVSKLTVSNWINGVKGMKLRNYYKVREFLNIKD